MKAARWASVVLLGAAAGVLVLLLRALGLAAALHRHSVDPAKARDVESACIAFGVALALMLAGLRLGAGTRVKLALALVSAVAALYLAEGREAWDDPLARRLSEKGELIEALNRQGVRAYGGVEPVRFVWSRETSSPEWVRVGERPVLPLAGISRRTTVDCKEADASSWLVYESDEHGFHNPAGVWQLAPVELLALGDSFTAGSCVPSEQNMVARLRARYRTVLNLGMPGNGPLLLLAELQEYAPLARARLVLWCHFGGNDLRDLGRERAHPMLTRYLQDGFRQGLPEQQSAVDAALEEYYRSWLSRSVAKLAHRRADLGDFLSLRETRARLGLAFPDPEAFVPSEQDFRLFGTILTKARSTVEAWGGRLVFVYLPAWSGPPRQLGERAIAELEARTRQRVFRCARDLGLPVVDVASVFASHAHPESLFACAGCHYGPAGYALAAETVLKALAGLP